MNIRQRVKKLEKASKPNRPEVFIYHPIVRPKETGETEPVVIGVTFHAGNELVHLDRGEGEKLDGLYARMRAIVMEKTGARYAIALDEIVKDT